MLRPKGVGAQRVGSEVLFPQTRDQLLDVLIGVSIDALQHIDEVVEGVDLLQPAAHQQALQIEEAALFWFKASQIPNAEPIDVARVLVNRGFTQGNLGQRESEIATYDEVIRRFGEAPEVALREQVARAMVNKGITQGQLGRSEAAIATFDEVIRRFGEAPEVALREQVARAMVSKGATQGRMSHVQT